MQMEGKCYYQDDITQSCIYSTLAQFIHKQEKALPEPEVLNLFKQMVDALRFLHDHRILHRCDSVCTFL